jgi:hypothetical protein
LRWRACENWSTNTIYLFRLETSSFCRLVGM